MQKILLSLALAFLAAMLPAVVALQGPQGGTIGGGGGVSPNSPISANQAQGPRYNIKNYGSIGDAKKTVTAVVTNASSTITDATSTPWLVTDIGKKIYCVGQGGGGQGNSELSTTIATITAFTSSSSISVSPVTGNGFSSNPGICVWFTQKETTTMLAANTAAVQALKGIRPFLGPTLAYPGSVYCPEGGYVVDGPWFIQNSVNGNTLGVGFVGASKSGCTIYISPDVAVTSGVWGMLSVQNTGMTFSDFTVDCSLENLAPAGSLMYFNTDANFNIRNVEVDGCGSTGDSSGLLRFNADVNLIVDHLTINNAPVVIASAEPPIVASALSFATFRNLYTTNPGPSPMVISASGGQAFSGGPRSTQQGGVLIENSVIDEGGNPVVLQIANGSTVGIVGSSFFEGTAGGLSVDGTSSLYLSTSHIAPFNGSCSGGNRNAIVEVAGSLVQSTGNTLEACGTGTAVNGPSTATFYELGGTDYRLCPSGPPCALATFAQSFGGGVFPVFPLPSGSTTQLGGRQVVSGTAPTFAVTGFGTGPTVTVGTGSTDAAGSVLITAGTTPGSSGTFTLTFSTLAGAYGTNPPVCIFGLQNGTGSWNALAQEPVITTPSTTSVVANWADNSIALTAASTYGFVWTCYGK